MSKTEIISTIFHRAKEKGSNAQDKMSNLKNYFKNTRQGERGKGPHVHDRMLKRVEIPPKCLTGREGIASKQGERDGSFEKSESDFKFELN